MIEREHVSTETLADHAEGLLGESESGRISAHLAECEDCSATAALLVSLSDVLAADDVGPMPAHFAARIDSALADLYLAEPPLPPLPRPEPVAATAILASAVGVGDADNVVDLGSRRQAALVGLRRVGTIAASMVLLIAGAALGVQTLGEDRGSQDPDFAQPLVPQVTVTPLTFPKKIKVPADAVDGANGSKRDPDTGTVFLPGGRIVMSNGTVLVPQSGGGYAVLSPANTPVTAQPDAPRSTPKPAPKATQNPQSEPEPAVVDPAPRKGGDDLQTLRGGRGTPQPSARPSPSQDKDPAAPPEPSAAPAPKGDRQPQAARAAASSDPYVENSGRTYTEETFAALVMDLVAKAGQGSGNRGSFEPSSVTQSPTPSAARVSYPRRDLTPVDAERGPAPENVQSRVQRCAEQLRATAIAGDVGVWQGRKATIVVVDSEDPNQVNGFVFYGNCPKKRPVTAQSAQWEQRVDRPAPAAAPAATPAPGGAVQDDRARSREN
ncbi:MAG: hypothetical protein ACT4QF_17560 [Sporichthyaceae bacterium]